MRNATYEGLFYRLAQAHNLIRHKDDSPRFARIIVSVDPIQKQVDLMEMQETLLGRELQPGAGEQVLVLESLQTAYEDNKGDNYQHRRRGAFFVLEQVAHKDQAWQVLDRTEITGEELLGAVLHEYQDQPKVRWQVGSFQADAIGPVGSDGTWYGTRFDFEFFTPATGALRYKPAAFSF
ncbi:hypothetical protein GO988_15560 [Hymenobacter sp. HMF4947]|uniref:Uncharacterized protein n=1 Tax=Hymenobacter ginkgonis TaxID=2682976 RepID=A0A7K1TH54_9BACT|nr:hypothetical protein [Hymenobacter ginkgonis]MVN77750.1 hypothetical protein [Hymenobacter ginkgonis]